MDDSTSAQLFDHGAFFILLDFEPGGEFGIDWNSWTTDEKFKGVENIDPNEDIKKESFYHDLCESPEQE